MQAATRILVAGPGEACQKLLGAITTGDLQTAEGAIQSLFKTCPSAGNARRRLSQVEKKVRKDAALLVAEGKQEAATALLSRFRTVVGTFQ